MKLVCFLWVESGAPGGIRTPDPLVRSQMLYPAELRARAAILSKFAGGAAWCGVSVALNLRNCDGAVRIRGYRENRCYAENKTWVRQRGTPGDGNATEGYPEIAESG